MKVEVLVASRVKYPKRLIKSMNLNSNAIIANQGKQLSYEKIYIDNNSYKILNTPEKGVGRNRNTALDRSTGDICILADDDQTFFDNYEKEIVKAYKENPKADMILFNVIRNNINSPQIKKKHKVNYFNFMRYGAVRVSFKRKSVTKHGIHFNVHFGGGTEHSAGEDVLFLHDCLKKGLNIIAVDITLATINEDRESTWFKGYNKKFFIDKGILYATISSKLSYVLSLLHILKNGAIYQTSISRKKALRLMFQGIRLFKKNITYL